MGRSVAKEEVIENHFIGVLSIFIGLVDLLPLPGFQAWAILSGLPI